LSNNADENSKNKTSQTQETLETTFHISQLYNKTKSESESLENRRSNPKPKRMVLHPTAHSYGKTEHHTLLLQLSSACSPSQIKA
jgi:hypothetical protein